MYVVQLMFLDVVRPLGILVRMALMYCKAKKVSHRCGSDRYVVQFIFLEVPLFVDILGCMSWMHRVIEEVPFGCGCAGGHALGILASMTLMHRATQMKPVWRLWLGGRSCMTHWKRVAL